MCRRSQRGNNAACLALSQLSVTSPVTHKPIGPFWCWFPGGWVYVRSRTLWVPPTNSPVRLAVYLTTTTATGFYSQRVWGFIFLCWNPGLHGLSHSTVVPLILSTCSCGTAQSSSHCLDACSLLPSCLFPPLLLVWMKVSFLIPSLLYSHINFLAVLVVFCL